jgi:hypothetical protein
MASKNEKRSRAFIIGDREHGLTIVITDPVMVVHYSKENLADPSINQMVGKDPAVVMAGVVQELLPFMRGVDLDTLKQRQTEIRGSNHGAFSLAEEEGMFAELNNAESIARIIRNNGTVCDVDFCVALDINPADIVARGRSTGPAVEIQDYLSKYATASEAGVRTVPGEPQTFVISNLLTDNLRPLEPWVDPKNNP